MKLSIVSTLYKSSAHIDEFYQRMSAVAKQYAGESYELILVNDGSPDSSLELAVDLSKNDSHVVVIDLSRNFGHHKAIVTGLSYSKGQRVFLIDSDLEEEPEWLAKFSKRLEEEMCDVVYGVQEHRKGSLFERLSGKLFWSLINFLSGTDLPKNIITSRLMTRRYVDALVKHKEREVFLGGLCYITGFFQVAHLVQKHDHSESTYTFRKKISLIVNSITSFSDTPLTGIFYFGLAVLFAACLYICYLVFDWMTFNRPLAGWTSVMASIWFLGGLIISFIGVIGIYLSKVFVESKQRPYTIVRNVYSADARRAIASK